MNKRRRLTGIVTSDKMDKTVIVVVGRTYRHKLYKKVVHEKKKYMVHDELGCKIGDQVCIVECRPYSRRKRWAVEQILEHDITAGEALIETGLEVEAAE
jgi:small subunit ribosomal protein S17